MRRLLVCFGWASSALLLGCGQDLAVGDSGSTADASETDTLSIGETTGSDAVADADAALPPDATVDAPQVGSDMVADGDGADTAAVTECTAGETQCENGVPASCSAAGVWQPGLPCSAGTTCVNGACTPVPPCGNGKLDAGEACDDGNTQSGDGCSGSCAWEWAVLYAQDFSGGSEWSLCAGCAAKGCPSVQQGHLVQGGDATKLCIPAPKYVGKFQRLRFRFTVHAEAPLSAYWLAAGPPDNWSEQSARVWFDTVGGGITVQGKNAAPMGVMNALPPMPFTAEMTVEYSVLTGHFWAASGTDALQFVGTAVGVGDGPWSWNAGTNYACCDGLMTSSWVDDFTIDGVPVAP